jgi:hypothetical protein
MSYEEMSVEHCKHFDGKVCSKCGRMMPAYCKQVQDTNDKARKFDEMMQAKDALVATEEPVVKPMIPIPAEEPPIVKRRRRMAK